MIPWTLARSHVARAVQTGQPADEIDRLKREYVAARLCHHITTMAPALTDQQRAQLADLVMSGGGADGD